MKRAYLIMSLATVLMMLSFSIVFSLNVEDPKHPEFMVYKTIVPSVTREYVTDIATRIFNSEPAVEYADGSYIAESGSKYLQVYEASGAIWYADWSKMYNESYVPNLPSEVEGKNIAESFLKKHGLMPNEAYFKGISYSTTSIFHPDAQQVENMVNSMDVIFGFRTVEGISIEGPGAKIRVSIGEGGEIIGFHWAWRSIEPYEYRPGKSESKAIQEFCDWLSDPVKLKVYLAYYSEPGFVKQDYIQPYYIFNYEANVHGKPLVSRTQKMSAIHVSPTIMSKSQLSKAFTLSLPMLLMTTGLVWLKKRKSGLIAFLLTAVIGISIFMASMHIASAQPIDDTLNTEVGIEWVNAYPSYKGPLSNCDDDARGFRNELVAIGWTSSFDWGDSLAWEQDFKYRNGPGGGTDYAWIDAVDFAYFAGHGSVQCTNEALIWFSVNYDYQSFSSNNARWGGTTGGSSTEQADLEWIVLDACLTLKETHSSSYDVFYRWDQAFCGLHYILGFHTVCGDTGIQGPRYGYYLRIGRTVREAWIIATQEVQSSSVWGAYLRAGASGADTYNDRINPYSVSPDPYPWSYLAYSKWQC